MQTKETVKAVLDQLPDDCSLEDVLYHLYVIQAVGQGRAEVQAGKTSPHEQVAEELRHKWLVGAKGNLDVPGPDDARRSGRLHRRGLD